MTASASSSAACRGLISSLTSTLQLTSGYPMPIVGFGVYQNRGEGCYSACLEALKAGYRHIDSARAYRNEDEVGRAVRAWGGKREEVFVTSKITSKEHGYNSTLNAVDESLERFGFDYLDLFLIHDPLSGSAKLLDTYRALVQKVKEGKLRSIGVSNYGVKHLEELAVANLGIAPSVNQIEYHPWCQMRDIVAYCKAHDIVVQAYCPLARAEHMAEPKVVAIAEAHYKTPAQVLIRWSLQKGLVPLPKSSTPSRIIENAQVFDGFELTEVEVAQLDGLDRGKDGAVSWGWNVSQWKDE